MTMNLYIKDRIYFPAIFPAKGTFSEFHLKREIIRKIYITEEDRKKYSIKEDQASGQITWDSEKDIQEPLVVEFSEAEAAFIKKCCEQLNDNLYPDDFWVTIERIYSGVN